MGRIMESAAEILTVLHGGQTRKGGLYLEGLVWWLSAEQVSTYNITTDKSNLVTSTQSALFWFSLLLYRVGLRERLICVAEQDLNVMGRILLVSPRYTAIFDI